MDLHEGFFRVEGMLNCGGARFTDLTSLLHVRSAGGQTEQGRKNCSQKHWTSEEMDVQHTKRDFQHTPSAVLCTGTWQDQKAKQEWDVGEQEDIFILSCSQDILVAGKPPFQQSKSTLSATLNGTTQAISQWWTHCQVATLCQRQAGNKTVDL